MAPYDQSSLPKFHLAEFEKFAAQKICVATKCTGAG